MSHIFYKIINVINGVRRGVAARPRLKPYAPWRSHGVFCGVTKAAKKYLYIYHLCYNIIFYMHIEFTKGEFTKGELTKSDMHKK